jgi:hypothetical protein
MGIQMIVISSLKIIILQIYSYKSCTLLKKERTLFNHKNQNQKEKYQRLQVLKAHTIKKRLVLSQKL